MPPAESRARAVAAAWGKNPPWAQSSDQVTVDHASPGAAVDPTRFTTESQWIDYIIGMLVDMLSKPRVFYLHLTVYLGDTFLVRVHLQLTMDWSDNLLSCQRLDNGDSCYGQLGAPARVEVSHGSRTFIC